MRINIQIVGLFCLAIYGLSLLHSWVPHNHHQHNELATHSKGDHHHHHSGGHHHETSHDHEASKDKKGLKSLVLDLFHQHSHAPELAFEQDDFHKPSHSPGKIHPTAFEPLEQNNIGFYVESGAFNENNFRHENIYFPDVPLACKNGLRAPPYLG